MWILLRNGGKNSYVLGQGLELERAEPGVTSEVFHAVSAFPPFPHGSKEQLESSWRAADSYAQMAGKGTELVHTALPLNSSSTLDGIQSI